MDIIDLPVQVTKLLDILSNAGFEGHIVGGCVRDYLLDIEPNDFDVTTNALPSDMIDLFAGYTIVETGILHGTVMVVMDKFPIEVTTYRIDGDYVDHRHPSSIMFTDSLELDLARRDFTMNAIAYHPSKGIVDPYCGVQDIHAGIIRAVGEAEIRFEEDALRIMRAIRFVSSLGFEIEPATLIAMKQKSQLIVFVSIERVFIEFSKMLLGKYVSSINWDMYSILFVIFPELAIVDKSDKQDDHVVNSLLVISHCDAILSLRMAAFLYKIKDTSKITAILDRIKCDRRTKKDVLLLIQYLDIELIVNKSSIKRLLKEVGSEVLYNLFGLKGAINAFYDNMDGQMYNDLKQAKILCDSILENRECYSLSQLDLNGHDVLDLGIAGNEVGKALDVVLDKVIEGKLNNQKRVLLSWLVNNYNTKE